MLPVPPESMVVKSIGDRQIAVRPYSFRRATTSSKLASLRRALVLTLRPLGRTMSVSPVLRTGVIIAPSSSANAKACVCLTPLWISNLFLVLRRPDSNTRQVETTLSYPGAPLVRAFAALLGPTSPCDRSRENAASDRRTRQTTDLVTAELLQSISRHQPPPPSSPTSAPSRPSATPTAARASHRPRDPCGWSWRPARPR